MSAEIRDGSCLMSATSSAIRSLGIAPRSSARRRASRYIAATWQTNVFVAATETSRPARVYRTPSASRVACEPTTFVTASTFAPRSRARRIAASVSAVSPDCVIPMTSWRSETIGLR